MALPIALERVDQSLDLRQGETVERMVEGVVSDVPTPADNDAALAQLEGLLGGVRFG